MENGISSSLKHFIHKVTNRPIVMENDSYVYFDNIEEKVSAEVIAEAEVLLKEEIENQRISQIKAKASELILAKYSIIWQLNHPRTDVAYASDYAYIDGIRNISNEAELNGTALEDIDWTV